jgi:hypothetical protein
MPSLTRHATPRAWFVPLRARAVEKRTPAPGRRRAWVALVLLAGYLLFCHGCHGDEDNELFARLLHQPGARVTGFPVARAPGWWVHFPTSAAATSLSSSLSSSSASGTPTPAFWTTPLWSIITTVGMALTP